MHATMDINHAGPTKYAPTSKFNLAKSKLDGRNLWMSAVRITSVADLDQIIGFLQDHRADAVKFFAPTKWTAEELLDALKQAFPGGMVFHSRFQPLLSALNSAARFYIMDSQGSIFFSYGDCCRAKRRLDCPPEHVYRLPDLIQEKSLTFTRL